jgi:GNAT superfamily N-acetyltransferase
VTPDRPTVRAREERDLEACEELARAVHATDGYPMFVRNDDFRRFIASPDALHAWVAESAAGEIVGHVALHASTIPDVMRLAATRLAVPESAIAVIARLSVVPAARRNGLARRLLEVATTDARERGLVPLLDVVTRYEAAIAWYEREGWQRLGTVDFRFPNGMEIQEAVYRAPE